MKKMRLFSLLCFVLGTTWAWAQGPNGTKTYYQAADGLKGKELKTALSKVINTGAKDRGYSALNEAYATTDVREDGTIWDMYSGVTRYGLKDNGTGATREGQGWNREHTVPQSWFSEGYPMRSDVFHVYPTDIYVNSMRGSFPFGEVGTPTKQSLEGFSKVGPCVTPGYNKTVFEPADEYKGDLARSYFYMATRYESRIGSWTRGESVFGVGTYPGIVDWQLKLLLKWAKADPVSPKEVARNNAAFAFQNNRNPFIDYPGLEQYVWGDSVNVAFSYDNYGKPSGTTGDTQPETPVDPGSGENPSDPTTPVIPTPITPVEGQMIFTKVMSPADMEVGVRYLLVDEYTGKAVGAVQKNVRSYAEITINGGTTIQTAVDGEGEVRSFILGGTAGAYTFYDAVEEAYLWVESDKNQLGITKNDPSTTAKAQWEVKVNNGEVNVANKQFPTRYIKYNTQMPRFATYTTESNTLKYATLYKAATATGVSSLEADPANNREVNVYTLSGVLVRRGVAFKQAFKNLPKGIYLIDGKKFVVE